MSIFPVRRLGSVGIVPDVSPADLENPSAFTGGVNVRFKNGRVTRGPMFPKIIDLNHEPGHILSVPPSATGYDEVISIAHDFASMKRLNGQVLEDLTPPGHTGTAGTQPISSTSLGGVTYINRETHVPHYLSVATDKFTPIPDWNPNDRCKVLRAYKDQLIALGVTKNGQYYPTMVKWSDFAYFGAPPASWDPTLTTNSAGENIVNEMRHQIVDGLTLGDYFFVYCTGSVWMMAYSGDSNLYAFRKVFDEIGVLNVNCVAQVGGMHYVFDRNDIYLHDGATFKSIADDRVKDFVFGSLDYSKAHLCFVQHDPKLTEVRFSYPADDRFTGFRNPTTGCNRQAVYNYSNDTWTFYDVPNLTGSCKAALQFGPSWSTDPDVTFDTSGGSWGTTDGDEDRHVLVCGRSDTGAGLSAARVYGMDLLTGGRLPLPPHPETVKPAVLERTGLDLDFIGKHLNQYINLQAIWPQIRMDKPSDCYWQFGGNDFGAEEPLWSLPLPFDPATETKIDVNEAGKYAGYRFICGGLGDFQLSSFDIQLLIRGRR